MLMYGRDQCNSESNYPPIKNKFILKIKNEFYKKKNSIGWEGEESRYEGHKTGHRYMSEELTAVFQSRDDYGLQQGCGFREKEYRSEKTRS